MKRSDKRQDRQNRPTKYVAGIAAIAVLVAACAADTDGEAPEAPVEEGAGDAQDVDASESVSAADRETLRVGIPGLPVSLDPHGVAAQEQPTLVLNNQIFDTLVEREGDEFVPRLAVSWENPDPETWVFAIREGVNFHDGTALTAVDVAYSIDRLIELDGPLAPLFADVTDVSAENDFTVRITTAEPVGTLLSSLVLVRISQDGAEEGDFQEPVGTGAFLLEEWVPDSQIVLSANSDYWDGEPQLGGLEFVEIVETVGRVTSIETGEIDLTSQIPADFIPQLEGNADIEFEAVPSFAYYFIWFNNEREPFDDVRVRQALWHAVDIDTIVDDLFPGVAQTARAPIPEPVFGWSDNEPYEYDPELARELLAEAGYDSGFTTSVDWNSECCPNIRQMIETFRSYWAEIGVDVELREKERAEWLDDLLDLEWDINVNDNTVRTGDADATLARLYLCESERLGLCNAELDEHLLAARASVDQEERLSQYAEASSIMWSEAVGIFPMDLLNTFAYRSGVEGFEPPPDNVPTFRNVTVNR